MRLWPYRVRQFWLAARGKPTVTQMASAANILPPALFPLFLTLQPSEQAHACQVCADLMAAGHGAPELLQAALLHDSGKASHPLRLWERVLIVLGQAVNADWEARWGQGEPRGLRRAFVIAAQHPLWGARMAAAAGAEARVVELIRRHAQRGSELEIRNGKDREFEAWLRALQAADGEN
jgi:hypothetical protein